MPNIPSIIIINFLPRHRVRTEERALLEPNFYNPTLCRPSNTIHRYRRYLSSGQSKSCLLVVVLRRLQSDLKFKNNQIFISRFLSFLTANKIILFFRMNWSKMSAPLDASGLGIWEGLFFNNSLKIIRILDIVSV